MLRTNRSVNSPSSIVHFSCRTTFNCSKFLAYDFFLSICLSRAFQTCSMGSNHDFEQASTQTPNLVGFIPSLSITICMTRSSIPLEDKIPLLMHHGICKSREYILLHVAKREHLLDLIIEKYTGDTNISYLIQSFE